MLSLTSLWVAGIELGVIKYKNYINFRGFPGGAAVESPPADAGDTGSCPGPGRSHVPWSGWAREPWPLTARPERPQRERPQQ